MSDERMCGAQARPAGASATEGSVPSIDNSELFTSDEFRMFCMKVLPCSKRYSHDWPTCPFAHPGEKAKRRDPRTHQYDCEMCADVLKGETCRLGAACPHSHHVFESWLHPQKYRTLLCKDGDQCHREVCFFAHGTKQLRTPDRSSHQQQRNPAAGSANPPPPPPVLQQHIMPRVKPAMAATAQHSNRQVALQVPQAVDVVGSQQHVQAAGSGSSFAGSSSSSSTNISAATLAQLSRNGPSMVAGAAAAQQQLQQQRVLVPAPMQLTSAATTIGSTGGPADLSQLLQSLVAQVNASQHEAAESNRAAADAQSKLFMLQQLLGCDLGAGCPPEAHFAPAPSVQSPTPGTSPSAGALPPRGSGWQAPAAAAAAAAQQQLSQACWQQHLPLHQQQLLVGGGLDGVFPRRYSLDETLLRRVRHMQFAGGAGSSGLGRPNAWGTPCTSPVVPTGAGLSAGVLPRTVSGSAAADIEALAAAFAAAGGVNAGVSLGSMAGTGLASDSVLLSPGVCTPSQMPINSTWLSAVPPAVCADQSWSQVQLSGSAGQPTGALNSLLQLQANAEGTSQAAALNGVGVSVSASGPQLQSDYLLQLQAALQASGPALGHSSSLGPVRASFDTGAAYLPAIQGDMVVAGDAACVDDLQVASSNSLKQVSNCSYDDTVVAAVPEPLVSNPLGGANQMGWF